MPNRFDALIFDLDGVLVDTVGAHESAWRVIADHLGIAFDKALELSFRGQSRERCLDMLLDGATLGSRERTAILDWKNRMYLENVAAMGRDIRSVGTLEVVDRARREGFKLAVASASRNATTLLALADLTDKFDSVSDGAFSGPPKPAPDQLRSLAAALQIDPRRCVVLDDAPTGIHAAIEAGMLPISVGDSAVRGHSHVHSLAELAAQVRDHGSLEAALTDTLAKIVSAA